MAPGPLPDFQCTWWPDTWLGISLTGCCVRHDISSLDWHSSIALGACVVDVMAGTHPLVGLVLGVAMAIGTAIWCGIRYGLRGRR